VPSGHGEGTQLAITMTAGVTLGFCEPFEDPIYATSEHFPSKVGGAPAWLDPSAAPTAQQIACGVCGNAMAFLLQLSSPLDHIEDAYHRMLYLYCCTNGACHNIMHGSKAYACIRSQLPRVNAFYPEYSDDEDTDEMKDLRTHALAATAGSDASVRVFKELEIVNEPEPEASNEDALAAEDEREGAEQGEETLITSREAAVKSDPLYDEALNKDATLECTEDDAREMGELMQETKQEDKVFSAFMRRIKRESEQILRYERGGECLWVGDGHNELAKSVVRCPLCGDARAFEFQVMPHLLSLLNVDDTQKDSVDWGTLAIYTCASSCPLKSGCRYAMEQVVRQNFSDIDCAK